MKHENPIIAGAIEELRQELLRCHELENALFHEQGHLAQAQGKVQQALGMAAETEEYILDAIERLVAA